MKPSQHFFQDFCIQKPLLSIMNPAVPWMGRTHLWDVLHLLHICRPPMQHVLRTPDSSGSSWQTGSVLQSNVVPTQWMTQEAQGLCRQVRDWAVIPLKHAQLTPPENQSGTQQTGRYLRTSQLKLFHNGIWKGPQWSQILSLFLSRHLRELPPVLSGLTCMALP